MKYEDDYAPACTCHAFCACECICGSWDDYECDHCYSVEITEPGLHDWWCSDKLIKDACEHYRGGKYSVTLSSSPEFTNMYQDTWGDIQSVYEEDILR